MKFLSARPSPCLSDYVVQYWAIENCLNRGEVYRHSIIPTGLSEITFYFDDVPDAMDNNRVISDRYIVSGQQSSAYDLNVKGNLSMFSVTLKPYSLYLLFGIPATEFTNCNVSLRDVFASSINQIEDRLMLVNSFKERVEVVERMLLSLIVKNSSSNCSRIINGIGCISNSDKELSLDTLASDACLSKKQFERVFASSVGVTPKRFMKIVRFQKAIYYKQLNRYISLTDLAYACNYYDQSHMINDFKSLSGRTPGQLFNACDPYSDYFNNS